jgi:hypothetical protein
MGGSLQVVGFVIYRQIIAFIFVQILLSKNPA